MRVEYFADNVKSTYVQTVAGAQKRKFPGGAQSANLGCFGGLGPPEPPKTDHFGMPGGGARAPAPPSHLFCASGL